MSQGAFRLAIHGGCGNITPERLGERKATEVREALHEVLAAIAAELREGSSALDAAEGAVRRLEDCELFNAGRGSVLNADGHVETDAALMEGTTLRAGAVAALKGTSNPIGVARLVLEHSEHVLLAAEGARRFALSQGMEPVEDAALVTDERRRQLDKARAAGGASLDHDGPFGTVGAVVRDAEGRLAAATSTGGMTNKHPGRIGDSPVIGAGTWADDRTCAVSATGHGEFLVRAALAHDIHARMRYGAETLERACAAALESVSELGGKGGVIAVDAAGNLALPFTTRGMYRGWLGADGEPRMAIWDESKEER